MLKDLMNQKNEKMNTTKSLYRFIHRHKSASKIDMQTEFKIPLSTLNRMLDQLETMGLIRKSGLSDPNGGRPRVLYEILPTAGYIFGIAISRSHVTVLLLNLRFQVVGEKRFIVTRLHTPNITMKEIQKQIQQLLAEKQVDKDQLIGIGIGAVGPLNREKGMILNPEAFPAEGWLNVPIKDIIEGALSVPVSLNNGADLAVLAEYYFQYPRVESILYCTIGYGLRCSFIQEGSLLNKKDGDASSYGHIAIEAINGRPCSCGKKGCLNTYVTFDAIMDSIKTNDLPSFQPVENIAEYLVSEIRNDNPIVKEAILNSALYLGIGIANMVKILHPKIVVLDGQLVHAYQDYYLEVKKAIQENRINQSNDILEIRMNSFGEQTTAIGAAVQIYHEKI